MSSHWFVPILPALGISLWSQRHGLGKDLAFPLSLSLSFKLIGDLQHTRLTLAAGDMLTGMCK